MQHEGDERPSSRRARRPPPLRWSRAGSGPRWDYTAHPPLGDYFISAGARRGYVVRFANTRGKLPGGLWHELGTASSPNDAKRIARAHYEQHAGANNPPRRRATRSNPPSAWSGHASVRGGELMSRRVLRVEYEHVDDRAGVARRHDFDPGVFMYALKDGSVLIRHRNYPRTRVWADLPDKGRR